MYILCVCLYYIYRYREREIYFKELAHRIVRLASLESTGQTCRLEIPSGAEVVILSPKAVWR